LNRISLNLVHELLCSPNGCAAGEIWHGRRVL
jgi:hypothetical protein